MNSTIETIAQSAHNLPEVLTVREVATILRLGLNTAYALVRNGKLRSVRVGRQYRINRQALLEYLNQSVKECA